jgi:hypothetical protein
VRGSVMGLASLPPVLHALKKIIALLLVDNKDILLSQPNHKISQKDHYLVNTVLSPHDLIDMENKEKEEKDCDLIHFECNHPKLNLFLSTVLPFDSLPIATIEFHKFIKQESIQSKECI